jgi:hypothetical protein
MDQKDRPTSKASLNASVDRLPTTSFALNITCYLSDFEASLLHQFIFLLFLTNRPSINPVATRKITLVGSAIKVALKQQSLRDLQIAQMTAPQPKRTIFFSVLLILLIHGPKRSSALLGVEFKSRAD